MKERVPIALFWIFMPNIAALTAISMTFTPAGVAVPHQRPDMRVLLRFTGA